MFIVQKGIILQHNSEKYDQEISHQAIHPRGTSLCQQYISNSRQKDLHIVRHSCDESRVA